MTTIVYRDGILAADSLVTDRGARCFTVTKIGRINGSLWGAAGSLDGMQAFMDWARNGAPQDRMPRLGEEFEGVNVTPDGSILWYGQSLSPARMHAPYVAIGSGFRIALGALWMGATAKQAVECCASIDMQTGGDIVTLSLGE